ncbi:MAG: B12-binding domain-containing radical SAM protein [Planctomycetes bacterium]|nr:B12-binding domain-containing radical SAM protein [Planctomycetota bacterium]
MKLLLIGPSGCNNDGSLFKKGKILIPRLNLIHLAGLTLKDVEVEIVEELAENIDFETECDLVGITAFTCQATRAYKIADEFKKKGKTVIMGGIHVSSLPYDALKHADSIIIGEADYLWPSVINDFKNKKLKSIYKHSQLHDLKDLPIPRYDLVKKENYILPLMPVQASRGCPHNCDFCTVTKFFGGSYRFRPIDDVIRDIKASESKNIMFVDDNIIANRKYATELFTRLIPLKIRWFSSCTINIGHFPDLCRLATESGCFGLVIGVESIKQSNLNIIGKRQNKVSEYYRLLKSARENGLSIILSIIVGLDDDDESIFNDTIKFVSKIKPFMPLVGVPIPYPGTGMAKKLESDKRILHKEWFKYRGLNTVFSPRLLGKEKLQREALSTNKKLYTFKSIAIRSLNQPLKNILNCFFHNLVMRKSFNEIE